MRCDAPKVSPMSVDRTTRKVSLALPYSPPAGVYASVVCAGDAIDDGARTADRAHCPRAAARGAAFLGRVVHDHHA